MNEITQLRIIYQTFAGIVSDGYIRTSCEGDRTCACEAHDALRKLAAIAEIPEDER